MFGNNKPFGGSSAFGSSTFGSTGTPFGQNTTAFGAKPLGSNVFGTSFGTTMPTGGNIFGTTAPSAGTSVFGQSSTAFGQPVSTSSSGFGFGSTSTSGGLFGSSAQQNTSTGLFGSSTPSTFGAPRSTFGTFGSTSGGSTLFGSSQPQQSGGLFGQASTTSTGLFGSPGGFGSATSGTTIKFNAQTGSDTMMKNGVSTNINTRHQCITCMKEYENKSLEELRMEDYVANRKGPQGGGIAAFGSTGQTGLFGTPASTSTFSFGSNQNKPLFGGTSSNTFGTTSTGLFGQSSQSQGSGLFSKPVGFGTPTTTTASSFSFGSSTGGSLFGQSNQQKSLFGQPASTGLFGTTTTTQPSTAFGSGSAFGTGFGTGTQQTSSLFGPKPGGFGSATTAPSTFSFGPPSTNPGSSLFGQKQGTTAFGSTSTFGTGTPAFGSFGSTQTGTGTMGLFGLSKPTGTVSSFGPGTGMFGAGSTFGSSFGTLGSSGTGTSLFGNTAVSKPGFSFGSTPNTGFSFGQPGLGGGSLGFNTSGLSSNPLVDQNAQALAQQQLQAQQVYTALTTNPYGDNPLFRNIIKNSNKREEILKPTNPAAQKAAIASTHYRVSPGPIGKIKPKPVQTAAAGKGSLFYGLDESEADTEEIFVPRRSVKKLVLKPKAAENSKPNDAVPEASNLRERTPSPKPNASPVATPLTVDVVESRQKQNASSDSNKEPSTSKQTSDSSSVIEYYTNPVVKPIPEHARFWSLSLDDTIAALHTKDRNEKITENVLGISNSESDSNEKDTSQILSCEEENQISDNESYHPAGLILRRSGYYIIPPLDELATYVDEYGNCMVEDLTIGREGYGSVFFPGETNVAGLNLDEIVHFRRKEITIYPDDDNKPPVGEGLNKQAQVTLDCVWPIDKTSREPIKDLERLKEMGYQDRIEKATLRLGAKFIEYRPETGSWVFQVNHFSKYGLEDSDEEAETTAAQAARNSLPPQTVLKQPTSSPNEAVVQNGTIPTVQNARDDDDEMEDITAETFPKELEQEISAGMNGDMVYSTTHHLLQATGANINRIQGMKASLFHSNEEDEFEYEYDEEPPKSSHKNGYVSTTDRVEKPPMKKFAVSEHMQHSIFTTSHSLSPSRLSRISARAYPTPVAPSSQLVEKEIYSSHPILPSGVTTKLTRHAQGQAWKGGTKVKVLPFTKSLLYNRQRNLADMGFFMGRSFRPGWGPKWQLSKLGEHHQSSQKKSPRIDGQYLLFSPSLRSSASETTGLNVVIERIEAFSSLHPSDATVKKNIEELLSVQLSHSSYTTEDGAPIFVAKPGVELLHSHAESVKMHAMDMDPSHHDAATTRQSQHVFELCVALWGNISGNGEYTENTTYARLMARREAFSKWLIATTTDKAQHDIQNSRIHSDGYLSAIFSHLSCHQIVEACNVAQEARDNRLSLLLAQAGSNLTFRNLIQKQLESWGHLEADRYVNVTRLKIYALLAGALTWQTSFCEISCCDNLDWKRALSIHLWYYCSPTSGISEAVTEYEKSFEGTEESRKHAYPPLPPYIEEDPALFSESLDDLKDEFRKEQVPYDTNFHLLKLYCDRSHRMDKLLNPTTSTPSHLDYRLSWLLLQVLQTLGYTHLEQHTVDAIHCNFASQLESLDLWYWAIFVALHITDVHRRKALAMDLLYRHITLDGSETANNCEDFLCNKIRVPKEWIFLAKAVKAKSLGRTSEEAWYLLKSGDWNKSHELIISHLAADAIIDERYDYLKEFLEELAYPDRSASILDWNVGGQVFLDYIHIAKTMEKVIKDEISAYDLEKLQPEVVSLCHRLSSLRCQTAKDRLCQSEMAKKTATLLQAVLMLQTAKTKQDPRHSGQASLHLLSPYLSKLPMPEDYTLQELRAMTRSYMLSITRD